MTETKAVAGTDQVARRMTRGFAALGAGRVVTLGLQLLAFALVAANLGPAGVGAYTFALALYSLFAYVTNFGVRAIAMRDITQQPEHECELVTNLFYLRLLMGFLGYGVLLVALTVGGYSSVERQAALVAGVLLVVLALESFQVILEVRLRMGWVSIAAVVQGVVLAAGSLVAGIRGAGVVGFLWVFVASNVANFAIVATVALRQSGRLRWRPRPVLWVRLARAAVLLGLAQLCITLYYRLDLLILAAIKPDDDVGQYGAAYRVLETFVVVPSLAMTVLTPVIAASVVAGVALLQRRYGRLMHLIALLSFPVAVAGMMTAARVLPAVPGFAAFEGAGVALAVLAPAAPCIFFGTALSAVLVSGHEQGRLLTVSFVGLVVNVLLNIALIPPFSFVGAAVATTITEVAVVAGLVHMIKRHVGVAWPWARVTRAARASVAMAAVLALGYWLPPFVQLGLGIVAYAVFLVPTGSLRWDDLGGLMGASGPTVMVPSSETSFDDGRDSAVDDEVRAVALGTPWQTWRGLHGVGTCILVESDRRLPTWLPVAARLAGADPVVLHLDRLHDGTGRLRNLLWPWFVARVAVGPEVDAERVRSRWPRLAGLVDGSTAPLSVGPPA